MEKFFWLRTTQPPPNESETSFKKWIGYEVIVFPWRGKPILCMRGVHFPVYFGYPAGRLHGDESCEAASGAGGI